MQHIFWAMEIIPIFSPEYQTFNFCIFLGLNKTMAASLGYLLDETDPSLTQGVLFEVRLELSEPDVIFVPPLDKNLVGNFYDQINGYLDDIFFGCSLIPRVAKHLDKGYETDKAKDNKISLIFFSILLVV